MKIRFMIYRNSRFSCILKKIEAIIRPGVRDAVVAAIKNNGVGGVTIQHVQGQGSQDPPWLDNILVVKW